MGIEYDRRRFWKLGKQKAFRCYPKIKLEIEKAKNKNQGLSSKKIKKILNCSKSFGGCFASDQLENLSITSFPIYLIVNTDSKNGKGVHWLTFYISKHEIELFDSLGLIHRQLLPKGILRFIHRLTVSRKFKCNPRIQPDNSILCGFYCILFIMLRQQTNFRSILSLFTSNEAKNDTILESFYI